jgi:Flp pilus assembly protein TadD
VHSKEGVRRTLRAARRLADRGELDVATALCLEVVRGDPLCTEAHFLLGIIAHASGDDSGAERYLRQALYLEPDHRDAAGQLALLLEGSNRPDQARIYRNRARARSR